MIKTYAYGQKISYKYKKAGSFRLQASNNVSSLNIVGTDQTNTIQNQLRAVKNINLSVSVIRSNCFRQCSQLEYASFETSRVRHMESACFSDCAKLKDICLGTYLSSLSRNLASSCPKLSSLSFTFFESDDLATSLSSAETQGEYLSELSGNAYSLQYVDDSIVSECRSLTSIVLPPSISSINQISKNALNGSNIKSIGLLGISSDSIQSKSILQSQCFGVGQSCSIEAADGKILKYTGKQLETADPEYDVSLVVKKGKVDKLRLGKAYQFDSELVNWCLKENVPFVTVFFDSRTSLMSKAFAQGVLFDKNMSTQLKQRNFFIFMLDRCGMLPGTTSDANLQYYRTSYAQVIRAAGGEPDRDFVSLDFIYNGQYNGCRFTCQTLTEFTQVLDKYASMTGFDKWDSSKYKVKVDIPDDETIPSKKLDPSGIKKWSVPDWYKSGKITGGTEWTPSSECMNFKFVSTPDTTYCIICAYDMNYPDNPPEQGVRKILNIFKEHSNHVDCYYEGKSGSAKTFLNGLEKGITYHYFMFFEFSHGGYRDITLPGGVSRNDVWKALKNARNRLIGMFDSCHSGSMIKTVSPYAFSAGANVETFGDFLVKKFKEQRNERIKKRKAMLKSSAQAANIESEVNEDEPAIWMWSSTAEHNYGWYYPGRTTVFANAIYDAYSSSNANIVGCSKKRNTNMWAETKENGTCNVGQGIDECIPQNAKYGDDFEKNMTFT